MAAPTPPTFPISKASFISNTFTFDPLYASDTISQSANIAGGLNAVGAVLPRGTVLCGPAAGTPVTTATILTTVVTGAFARFILAQDIDTSAGQITGLVYSQGKFLDTAMTFTSQGAALDAAQLWEFGIYVMTVEQRSGLLVPMMKLPTTGGPLPQQLSPKAAAETLKEDAAAIKAASFATPPGEPPAPVGYGPKEPAWAVAAFGPREPTPVEAAKEKTAEEASDLWEKQHQTLTELQAKQNAEIAELLKKHNAERTRIEEAGADAVNQARQAENAEYRRQQDARLTRLSGAAVLPGAAPHTAPPSEDDIKHTRHAEPKVDTKPKNH
jgi:hypothetical protein